MYIPSNRLQIPASNNHNLDQQHNLTRRNPELQQQWNFIDIEMHALHNYTG